jgi:hypothetical protein
MSVRILIQSPKEYPSAIEGLISGTRSTPAV